MTKQRRKDKGKDFSNLAAQSAATLEGKIYFQIFLVPYCLHWKIRFQFKIDQLPSPIKTLLRACCLYPSLQCQCWGRELCVSVESPQVLPWSWMCRRPSSSFWRFEWHLHRPTRWWTPCKCNMGVRDWGDVIWMRRSVWGCQLGNRVNVIKLFTN